MMVANLVVARARVSVKQFSYTLICRALAQVTLYCFRDRNLILFGQKEF